MESHPKDVCLPPPCAMTCGARSLLLPLHACCSALPPSHAHLAMPLLSRAGRADARMRVQRRQVLEQRIVTRGAEAASAGDATAAATAR